MVLREFLSLLGTNRRQARDLTREEAETVFGRILDGEGTDVQVGAFFMAMRWKGETPTELTGFAQAARDHARLPKFDGANLVAIGSPHDGKRSSPPLNAVAGLIAASVGVPTLQVTDRAPAGTGAVTSADVLCHLEAGWCRSADEASDLLERVGFAAVSACALLPGLSRLRSIRRELGVRTAAHTIEKLLLPPEAAPCVGVHKGPNLALAAEVLTQLGHHSGVVVLGIEGGADPYVTSGTPRVELWSGKLVHSPIEPADYGLAQDREPSPVRDGAEGAELALSILEGQPSPASACALLGAAQLIVAGSITDTLAEAVDLARTALHEGMARRCLDRLRAHHP